MDTNAKNVFGQPRLRASLRDLRSPRKNYKSTIEDDLKKLIVMDNLGPEQERDTGVRACGWRPRASGEGAMLSAVPPAFAVCRPCCGWGMQGGTEPGLKPAGEGPGDHESHVFLLEPKKKMVLPPLQIPATSRKSSQKLLRLSFSKDSKAEAAGSMVPPLPCLPLIVSLAVYGNLDSSSLGIVAHTCNLQETETGGSHDLGQPGLRGFLRPYLKRKGMCKCNDEMLI